jgi:hypothetical protein
MFQVLSTLLQGIVCSVDFIMDATHDVPFDLMRKFHNALRFGKHSDFQERVEWLPALNEGTHTIRFTAFMLIPGP